MSKNMAIQHISMFYLELGSEYIIGLYENDRFFFFFLGAANML